MLHFSRWKIIFIALVCLAGILAALPNFLSDDVRAKIPSWLPSSTVNLGLDLRGGSYLLLDVKVDEYLKEQIAALEEDVRKTLREKRIGYQNLRHNANSVSFTVRDASSAQKIPDLIREVNRDVQVTESDGNISAVFNEDYIKDARHKVMDQSIEIVRRRVDETGTREPIIQRQGDTRILLQVPGLEDPEHLKLLLGKTAKLTFHLLDETTPVEEAMKGRLPVTSQLLKSEGDEQGRYYVVQKQVMLGGDALVDARAGVGEMEPIVNFRFNTAGARKFAEITKDNVGHPFAIVLDNHVISAPVIREPILGGSGQISGNFTLQSANDLALLLRAGSLPAPLEVLEERTVGPSLGADSIAAGKKASLIGVIFVVVLMVVMYPRFGWFANVALIVNLILILAVMSLLQATLTLPGIAGIVLTMGMAVDANVLIYERIRDEVSIGRTPFAAIDQGFRHAFTTITDANVTTLISALLLYIFGSGSVKGFGVTLTIGILSSMFTAVLLTRLMIVVWLKKTRPKVLKL